MRPVTTNGFTLLELLVVIVIISILFSFVTLSVRPKNLGELIEEEANRMNRLFLLAHEEAILRGEEYGLRFTIHGYKFLRYEKNKWVPMETDKILRSRELTNDMEIELSIEEIEIELNATATTADTAVEDEGKEDGEKEGEENSEEEPDELGKKTKPQVFLLSSGEISPEFSAHIFIPGIEDSFDVSGKYDGTFTTSKSEF